MKKLPTLILLLILLSNHLIAGESLFGVTDKSIGFLQMSYSAAGLAKSYEVASTDSLQINFQNFSLWTQLSATTYTIMGGYKAAFGDDGIKNDYYSDLANFQGGYLGIPIQKKKFVLGFGIQPISYMEQRYSESLDSNLDETIFIEGGLSRATFNLSYNFKKKIGLGIGYEYTFGKIRDNYLLEEPGNAVTRFGFNYEYRFYGHGVVLSAHSSPFKNFTVGLSARPPVTTKVRVKAFSTSTKVNESSLSEVTLPGQINFGMEYKIKPRTKMGLDLLYQDWASGYKIDGEKYDINQDKFYRIGVGFERSPSAKRFVDFKDQVDYRVGLFYGNLNQLSNNSSVTEYGLSFGLSLPIQRFVSKIDISGLVGKRGDLSKNAYEETFFSVGFTISASELWFMNIDD